MVAHGGGVLQRLCPRQQIRDGWIAACNAMRDACSEFVGSPPVAAHRNLQPIVRAEGESPTVDRGTPYEPSAMESG